VDCVCAPNQSGEAGSTAGFSAPPGKFSRRSCRPQAIQARGETPYLRSGYRLALDQHREQAEELLKALMPSLDARRVGEILEARPISEDDVDAGRRRLAVLDADAVADHASRGFRPQPEDYRLVRYAAMSATS
jgi:hypothetical protein